jgi:hypothetical protein
MSTRRSTEKSTKFRTPGDAQLGRPLDEALEQFPHGVGALTGAERFDILDNWVHVLDSLYAHLPLKAALYGFNPVRAIERLRQQASELTDLQFLGGLSHIISQFCLSRAWAVLLFRFPFA